MAQTTIQGTFLGDGTVTGAKIGADFISAQTALTSGLATTDEIIVSDAGVIKRMDISVIEIAATQITASGTLPALNGSNLTALNATQLTSGTIPDARFPATLPAISGANLTNLPASGATLSGTTDNTIVTVTGSNAMIGETTLTYDASGNTNVLQLSNVESATNKHARIQIKVGASSGDPVLEWCVDPDNNVAIWSMGIDNTNEHFYLMNGSQPGQGGATAHVMEWDTTGAGHKTRIYSGNGDADEHGFLFFEHPDESHGLHSYAVNGPYSQQAITVNTLGTIGQNWHDTASGICISGYSEGNYSLGLVAWPVTETTTQASNQGAAVAILGQRHDGSNGSATFGSSANIVRIGCNRSSGGATKFIFRSDGTGYAETSWTTYSDNRIKTEQAVVPYGLDTIMQLQPKVYNKHVGSIEDGVVTFHDELEESPNREIGFIAQEVKAIIPEVIPSNEDENNSWYALDDGKLMAVVVKAIQELNAKVDALGS